jgi:excisionase family DNA binding protein
LNTTPNRPELYDIPGAADYLHTTERHIRRLWLEGRLGGHKLNKKIRFRRADLDSFLDANRVEPRVG